MIIPSMLDNSNRKFVDWTESKEAHKPELHQFCQKEPAKYLEKYCEKIVEGYYKCLIQVQVIKS